MMAGRADCCVILLAHNNICRSSGITVGLLHIEGWSVMRESEDWYRFALGTLYVWRVVHLLRAEEGPWDAS